MLKIGHVALGLVFVVVATACGNSVMMDGTGGAAQTGSSTHASGVTTVTTTSSTMTTSSVGAGGSAQAPGECKTNADCPPDGMCIELIPDGYRMCQFPVTEATSCTAPTDECCKTSDCTTPGDKCVFQPFDSTCGGVAMQPHNQCVKDECSSAADCKAPEICAPPGVLGNKVRVCLPGTCTQAVCLTSQENHGFCIALKNPCCSATLGLACARGCVTDMDCPNGYCDLDGNGFTVCKTGFPMCPG